MSSETNNMPSTTTETHIDRAVNPKLKLTRLGKAVVATALSAGLTIAAFAAVGGNKIDAHPADDEIAAPAQDPIPESTTTTKVEVPIAVTSTTSKPAAAPKTKVAPKTSTNETTLAKPEASSAMHEKLKKSSFSVVRRVKGSTGAWGAVCDTNAVKNVGGEIRFPSSAHCFAPNSDNSLPEGNEAPHDISETTGYEFGIKNADAGTNGPLLAKINGIVVSREAGLDLALLRADETTASPDFKNIVALPLSDANPEVGESMLIYGAPDANGNTPVSATGKYLGRGNFFKDRFDVRIVGVDRRFAPKDNPFGEGASGSASLSATGDYSGPLSFDLKDANSRNEVAQELGFDADAYPSIAAFSVFTSADVARFESAFGRAN